MPIFPCFDHGGMADRRISNIRPPTRVSFEDCVAIISVGCCGEGYPGGKAVSQENTYLVFGCRRGKASKPAEKCASCARHTAFPPRYPSTQQPTDIISTHSSKDTAEDGLVLEILRPVFHRGGSMGKFGSFLHYSEKYH